MFSAAYYCPPNRSIHDSGRGRRSPSPPRKPGSSTLSAMTQWLASPSHPSLMTRQHWLVDRLVFRRFPESARIRSSNQGFFSLTDYLVTIGASPRSLASFPWMFGNSRKPRQPSNEDIARSLPSRRLTDPAGHGPGKSLPPHWDWSFFGAEDMAKAIGPSRRTDQLRSCQPLPLAVHGKPHG